MWANSCQTCIVSVIGSSTGALTLPARHTLVSLNAGMYLCTGSVSSKRPSSHSCSASTAVIGLVIEKMRQMVSASTGSPFARSRWPDTEWWTTLPCRATAICQPVSRPSSM